MFDSGGLSIKTAGGMETMKTDMSGGAAVIAAMSTLRDLDVKTRVIGFIPLVENMPSGDAMRPGDVLRMRNGKTVEVLNTDAEGRLILADALSLASEEKPDAIIDLATLTGACVVALGEKVAGLMGSDDAWVEQVRAAADRAGESVWHLPLPEEYRKMIDSEIADIKNISGAGGGGALDRGPVPPRVQRRRPVGAPRHRGPGARASDDGYVVRGGTGFGVRTLVELARTSRPRSSRLSRPLRVGCFTATGDRVIRSTIERRSSPRQPSPPARCSAWRTWSVPPFTGKPVASEVVVVGGSVVIASPAAGGVVVFTGDDDDAKSSRSMCRSAISSHTATPSGSRRSRLVPRHRRGAVRATARHLGGANRRGGRSRTRRSERMERVDRATGQRGRVGLGGRPSRSRG